MTKNGSGENVPRHFLLSDRKGIFFLKLIFCYNLFANMTKSPLQSYIPARGEKKLAGADPLMIYEPSGSSRFLYIRDRESRLSHFSVAMCAITSS